MNSLNALHWSSHYRAMFHWENLKAGMHVHLTQSIHPNKFSDQVHLTMAPGYPLLGVPEVSCTRVLLGGCGFQGGASMNWTCYGMSDWIGIWGLWSSPSSHCGGPLELKSCLGEFYGSKNIRMNPRTQGFTVEHCYPLQLSLVLMLWPLHTHPVRTHTHTYTLGLLFGRELHPFLERKSELSWLMLG